MPAIDMPCEAWVTAKQVRGCAPCNAINVDEQAYSDAALVASAWLWRATGRQFSGQCTEHVRPVPRCGWNVYMPGYYRRAGTSSLYDWFDSRTGNFGPANWGRRGEDVSEVTLGFYPVHEVTQVKIDGMVLSPSAYRIDDARFLVRTDGDSWPSTNELWREDTEPNTWSVDLIHGDDPPADGVLAAEILACEIVKASTGSDECRLPRGLQTLSRQGVSLVMVDPTRMMEAGIFGIFEVDNFVRSTNPSGLKQRSTVINVDVPRAVRRTGTAPGS